METPEGYEGAGHVKICVKWSGREKRECKASEVGKTWQSGGIERSRNVGEEGWERQRAPQEGDGILLQL